MEGVESSGRVRIQSRDVLGSLILVDGWDLLGGMVLVSGRSMDFGMIQVSRNGEKQNSEKDSMSAEGRY
jgi:hypothetical protein